MKVGILMGSKSDFEVVKPCISILKRFGVEVEARVISAHRTPDAAHEYVKNAENNGVEVLIGVAGKAAHLAGVMAGYTTLPVIALPVSTKFMGGLDSLLSMVQMPPDVPVATVGVDAGKNAGILAVQMLSLKYDELKKKLREFKTEIAKKIENDDLEMQKMVAEI